MRFYRVRKFPSGLGFLIIVFVILSVFPTLRHSTIKFTIEMLSIPVRLTSVLKQNIERSGTLRDENVELKQQVATLTVILSRKREITLENERLRSLLDFKKSLIFCLIFLWFYAFLSGASIPTRRAALMYTVFAITFLIRRKHNVFNGLALAGLVTLFIAPEALFTISFQLSFCAVSSILIGFRVFKIKTLSNRLANYIKQLFFCSLFVNIGLLPLISFYFGRIYILSIIYNIVFIPFFTLVLGLGFLLIILSFWGFAAGSLGYLLSLLVAGFIQLTHFLGGVRFAFIYYRFSLGQAWLYYPCLFLALSPYIWYKYYKMGE